MMKDQLLSQWKCHAPILAWVRSAGLHKLNTVFCLLSGSRMPGKLNLSSMGFAAPGILHEIMNMELFSHSLKKPEAFCRGLINMAMNSAGEKHSKMSALSRFPLLSSEPAHYGCRPLWNHRGVKVFKESVPNNSYGGAAWCFLFGL